MCLAPDNLGAALGNSVVAPGSLGEALGTLAMAPGSVAKSQIEGLASVWHPSSVVEQCRVADEPLVASVRALPGALD